MYLIKDNKTNRYYKTKWSIKKDTLKSLHSLPFIKSNTLTEEETMSLTLCCEKFPHIEEVARFDGRRKGWMKDCEWFTWLCVIN